MKLFPYLFNFTHYSSDKTSQLVLGHWIVQHQRTNSFGKSCEKFFRREIQVVEIGVVGEFVPPISSVLFGNVFERFFLLLSVFYFHQFNFTPHKIMFFKLYFRPQVEQREN
jgi:hypothetical protein